MDRTKGTAASAGACPYCGKHGLKLDPPRKTGARMDREATTAERVRCTNPEHGAGGLLVAVSDVTDEMVRAFEQNAPRTAHRAPRTAHRIASPDDVAPVLAEVMAAAEADDRLTDNARRVLTALHTAALDHNPPHVETAASHRWVMERASVGRKAALLALRRLDDLGYARRITREQVTSLALRVWLGSRTGGRTPVLVRLADRPPVAPK